MRKIILTITLLALLSLIIVGCNKTTTDDSSALSGSVEETADLDQGLNELNDLEQLDQELDIDFSELDNLNLE